MSTSISRRTALAMLASLGATGCLRLGFLAANIPARFGDYQRTADIPFGEGAQQKLDVYVPTPLPPNAPLIVFWYGGRWEFGDKAQYRFVGAALASLGYIAVLPNYRHYPKVKMAGFMADAAGAAVWAHRHGAELAEGAHAVRDSVPTASSEHATALAPTAHAAVVAPPAPNAAPRIYFMGHSAGGHIAALLALDTHYLRAAGEPAFPIAGVIGLSGAYDFLPFTEDDTRDMFGPPEQYEESQPIHFARADAPPMLLIHGDADRTVYPKNSINLAEALQAKGSRATLQLYPKLKHADTVAALSKPARGRAPVLRDIHDFIAGI